MDTMYSAYEVRIVVFHLPADRSVPNAPLAHRTTTAPRTTAANPISACTVTNQVGDVDTLGTVDVEDVRQCHCPEGDDD